jgi:hypothetical protein
MLTVSLRAIFLTTEEATTGEFDMLESEPTWI